jgi:serine/threonine protein kinase
VEAIRTIIAVWNFWVDFDPEAVLMFSYFGGNYLVVMIVFRTVQLIFLLVCGYIIREYTNPSSKVSRNIMHKSFQTLLFWGILLLNIYWTGMMYLANYASSFTDDNINWRNITQWHKPESSMVASFLTFMFWPAFAGMRFCHVLAYVLIVAVLNTCLCFLTWAQRSDLAGYTYNFESGGWLTLNIIMCFLVLLLLHRSFELNNRLSFLQRIQLEKENLQVELAYNPFKASNLERWAASGLLKDQSPGLGKWEIPFSRLKIGKILGSGGGGVVFEGHYGNRRVAVKQVFATLIDDATRLTEFTNECATLCTLVSNPNIVRLLGVSKHEENIYVVMEWCESSLQAVIVDTTFWPTPSLLGDDTTLTSVLARLLVVSTAQQTCSALAFLHENNIVHLDLKPANVLLEDKPKISYMMDAKDNHISSIHVKLCDFGLARNRKTSAADVTVLGTLPFMAPEILSFGIVKSSGSHSPSKLGAVNTLAMNEALEKFPLSFEELCAVDVYAFGVLLHAVCHNNTSLYDAELEACRGDAMNVWRRVRDENLRPIISADCPRELADMMQRCWAKNSSSRPTAAQLAAVCNPVSLRVTIIVYV